MHRWRTFKRKVFGQFWAGSFELPSLCSKPVLDQAFVIISEPALRFGSIQGWFLRKRVYIVILSRYGVYFRPGIVRALALTKSKDELNTIDSRKKIHIFGSKIKYSLRRAAILVYYLNFKQVVWYYQFMLLNFYLFGSVPKNICK